MCLHVCKNLIKNLRKTIQSCLCIVDKWKFELFISLIFLIKLILEDSRNVKVQYYTDSDISGNNCGNRYSNWKFHGISFLYGSRNGRQIHKTLWKIFILNEKNEFALPELETIKF